MKNQECLCSIQYLLPIHLSRECTVVGNIWQLGVDFKTLVGDIIGLGGDDIIGLGRHCQGAGHRCNGRDTRE